VLDAEFKPIIGVIFIEGVTFGRAICDHPRCSGARQLGLFYLCLLPLWRLSFTALQVNLKL